ncbi:MAG: ABC transporter ATP-binding protein [Candidatus Odinarchaeota archaeon]
MIELKDVWASYGRLKALKGINLRIKPQEYVVILGPSGAGKTTLLKVIAGLIKLENGEILLGIGKKNPQSRKGEDRVQELVNVTNYPPEKRDVAFLPQTYALFEQMTVWDNTVFGPKVKYWKTDRIDLVGHEILQLVKLDQRTGAYPDELSGGMQQRCALARSLAASSKILLLDEPLRALDARLRIELREELKRLSSQLKMTTIHVTHDQEEAMTVADRIIIMNKGHIEQIGTPEDVYFRPATPFVASFIGEASFLPGRVTSRDGEITGIQVLNNAGTIKTSSSVHEQGDRVVVAVKPERIRLIKQLNDPEPNHCTFTGNVLGTYFLGRFVSLKIELEGIKRLVKIKIPGFELKEVEVGQTVHFTFSAKDCVVFAHDGSEIDESFAEE